MLTREEAEKLVTRLVRVTEVRVTTSDDEKYAAMRKESRKLRNQLINALCGEEE